MKRAVLLLLAILTALSITACKDLKDMIPTTPPAEIPAGGCFVRLRLDYLVSLVACRLAPLYQ